MSANNKRRVIAVFVLAAIAIGAWVVIQPFSSSEISMEIQPDKTVEPMQRAEPVITDEEKNLTAKELLAADSGLTKMRRLQDASHSQIEFYGKILDQHGEPVEGGTVNYSYTYYPKGILPAASWSSARGRVITDQQGRFEIKGHEGVFLSLKNIEKPGYDFRPQQELGYIVFTPRDAGEQKHIPDPENPVVIQAWRKGYAANELKQDETWKIFPADGQQRELPIPESNEAFKIAFENLDAVGASGRPQWRARLSAIGGAGLIETSDLFNYEAPENGYVTEWDVVSEENSDVERTFYFKTRDGTYGYMTAKFIGYYGNSEKDKQRGYIRYQYTLNPTGSRNLLPADE